MIDIKDIPSESTNESEAATDGEKELRLFVPREYVAELELILHQSETKFVKSLNEGIHGGDFEGYIFEFEDEAKYETAEAILEEMFTYIAGVWYSPKIAKDVEGLLAQYSISIIKTSEFKVFGKTVRIRNSIKGRETDLNAFFTLIKRLKNK